MITRDPISLACSIAWRSAAISRSREVSARRTVLSRIIPEGLQLLARLDEPVQEAHRKQLGHLGRVRLRTLSDLLRACRSRVA
jgi:hypothetical protein